ncbi:hypothetical protein [Pimelobacter simplex]|uniref:hypothetical protein n=1 Tax=Nocardioides simplex TaxID=2045 RepID=UPI0013762C3B|nr:hypothetical protein [Pimelobacter simplex]
MSSLLSRARSHYRSQQRVALGGVRAVRQVVRSAETPRQAASAAASTLATYQLAAAMAASRTMAREAGRNALSSPAAFAGTTQLGWPIESPIETIVSRLTADLDGEIARLQDSMLASLDIFVQSEIVAAGADAASVEIVAGHEWTRFVRVLDLPSCDRCVILAGRIYRDLEGFARHPRCDCQHWPVSSQREAEEAGLVTDPMAAFEQGLIGGYRIHPDGSTSFHSSLSEADRRAIADGADIGAVVNAKRGGGRRPKGMTNVVSAEIFNRTVKATLEGTTKRSAWRRAHPDLPIRLRPESIYEHAKDRDDALRLLRLYGYVTNEDSGSRKRRDPTRADAPAARSAEDSTAAPAPAAAGGGSGGGGGGRPPADPPTRPLASGEPPEPGDKDATARHWQGRQDALEATGRFTASGETLQPEEVVFVERMLALGHELAWIATGSNGVDEVGTLPTNDFIWVGAAAAGAALQVEHKAIAANTPADVKHIARQIRKALHKNQRRLIVTNVVIDLGDQPVTDETLAELAKLYGAAPRPLERLWVMSRGRLHRVL